MSALPDWPEHGRVGFDVETKDPDLREMGPSIRRGGGHICGYSFAIEDGPSMYLPVRHEGGDNVDCGQAFRYLRHQAKRFKGILIGANMQYDIDWCSTEDVEFDPLFFRDVQVADPLINEHHYKYSLDAILKRYGFPGKNQATLEQAARDHGVDPKRDLHRLPGRFVGTYATADVSDLPYLLRKQEVKIEEEDLWQVFDLESRVLPILVRMRQRGVRFSWDRLRGIENWSIAQEGEALGVVRQLTGVDIKLGDVWKPEPLARALREIGIDVPKTAEGSDSVTKELLASVKHPVAEAIGKARKVNKLRTTFAASIRRFAVGDRIHCTFNQLRKTDDENDTDKGAAYGRLSSELPNMQQQPARDELAKPWRKIYLPDEGKEWCSADYSQQEPRWTVHFAEVMRQKGAREAAQKYRDDPNTDNHDLMTRMIYGSAVDTWDPAKYKRMRGFCKEIYLGKCYGMGGAKLCRKLGLPTGWTVYWSGRWSELVIFKTREEAWNALREGGGEGRVSECAGEEGQQIISKFDQEAPFVKGIAKAVTNRANENGFIRTWSGRRCRFPQLPDGSYEWAHKALNRLIQGCSADQTKMAMIAMEAEGIAIQLQVHDEVDWSISSREEAALGAEIMRNVIPLRVPMKVDVEIGPSWGEAEAA